MFATINQLQTSIGYTFNNPLLLQQALTHKSYASAHNERLEFLGDSILNTILASILFNRFHQIDEGYLTKLRAQLVNKAALYNIALDLQISKYIAVGESENKYNISKSILSDSIESIIAAIYLDSDWQQTFNVVKIWYKKYLAQIKPSSNIKDYKSSLQELMQSKKYSLPVYKVVKKTGQDHTPIFTVSCCVEGLQHKLIATGHSKNIAEQNAAKLVLHKLNKL